MNTFVNSSKVAILSDGTSSMFSSSVSGALNNFQLVFKLLGHAAVCLPQYVVFSNRDHVIFHFLSTLNHNSVPGWGPLK